MREAERVLRERQKDCMREPEKVRVSRMRESQRESVRDSNRELSVRGRGGDTVLLRE